MLSNFALSSTENKQIGLQIWSENDVRRVTVACWGDKEADGSRSGDFLGIVPHPGEEDKFCSSWVDFKEECERFLETLKNTYPEEIREDEFQCGLKAGD